MDPIASKTSPSRSTESPVLLSLVFGGLLLIGIVKKNGIMLVDFAIAAERDQRMPAIAAIREACLLRFRPILMTSFSTILGILPIAIGWGAGGESRRPMGVAAVGGMLTSTFLTLLLVPVAYTLFSDWGRRRARAVKATGALVLALLLAGARAAQAEELAGDALRVVAHALELGVDLDDRVDEPQGSRDGLLPHDELEAEAIDLLLQLVEKFRDKLTLFKLLRRLVVVQKGRLDGVPFGQKMGSHDGLNPKF